MDIERIEIEVGDFTFTARAAGPPNGELVLLLHGFPQTSYEWRRQLVRLAEEGYRAVAPDQRGYSVGARPIAVSDYDAYAIARDAMGMATALGRERYHVVGHDWGAAVAWIVAALDAEHVVTVNVVSVPHLDAFVKELTDTTSCQYAASAYFDLFAAPNSEDQFLAGENMLLRAVYGDVEPSAVDEYVRVLGSKEAMSAALNWYRANVSGRMLSVPALGKTKVPTLFVWSDGDASMCREGAVATEKYVAAPYRFEILAGVDHWIVDKASDELNPLLIEHIGKYREKR
jgi:pimeloyl-ACP methyl ester carboxylesterase